MRTARPNDVMYFQPIGDRFNGSGVCLFTTIQNPVEVTHTCENITFARFATRAVNIRWFVCMSFGSHKVKRAHHFVIPSTHNKPCTINLQALSVCVEDLIHPFLSDPIDLVAGIDGTGFILGT